MNTNDPKDPSRTPQPDFDTPASVGTFTYLGGSLPAAPMMTVPKRTPISATEMRSLMMFVEGLQTRLLWLYCELAEEARAGQLAPAELRAKAGNVFDHMRDQLLTRLEASLQDCPTPIIVEPAARDDQRP